MVISLKTQSSHILLATRHSAIASPPDLSFLLDVSVLTLPHVLRMLSGCSGYNLVGLFLCFLLTSCLLPYLLK